MYMSIYICICIYLCICKYTYVYVNTCTEIICVQTYKHTNRYTTWSYQMATHGSFACPHASAPQCESDIISP